MAILSPKQYDKHDVKVIYTVTLPVPRKTAVLQRNEKEAIAKTIFLKWFVLSDSISIPSGRPVVAFIVDDHSG